MTQIILDTLPLLISEFLLQGITAGSTSTLTANTVLLDAQYMSKIRRRIKTNPREKDRDF